MKEKVSVQKKIRKPLREMLVDDVVYFDIVRAVNVRNTCSQLKAEMKKNEMKVEYETNQISEYGLIKVKRTK